MKLVNLLSMRTASIAQFPMYVLIIVDMSYTICRMLCVISYVTCYVERIPLADPRNWKPEKTFFCMVEQKYTNLEMTKEAYVSVSDFDKKMNTFIPF